MNKLTDAEILKRSDSYKWDNYAFTADGTARRYGLVCLRDKSWEDVQFCTLDGKTTPSEMGERLEDNWRRNKTEQEIEIKYLRYVEIPGLGAQHVMYRMAASSAKGEMFRCIRCACIRSGGPNFGSSLWSAYSLTAPVLAAEKRNSRQALREYEAWCEFCAPCPGQ